MASSANSARTGKCPVTSANRAMLNAFHHLNAKTVALITPYPPVIDDAIPDFFASRNITVRSTLASSRLTGAVQPPARECISMQSPLS